MSLVPFVVFLTLLFLLAPSAFFARPEPQQIAKASRNLRSSYHLFNNALPPRGATFTGAAAAVTISLRLCSDRTRLHYDPRSSYSTISHGQSDLRPASPPLQGSLPSRRPRPCPSRLLLAHTHVSHPRPLHPFFLYYFIYIFITK